MNHTPAYTAKNARVFIEKTKKSFSSLKENERKRKKGKYEREISRHTVSCHKASFDEQNYLKIRLEAKKLVQYPPLF